MTWYQHCKLLSDRTGSELDAWILRLRGKDYLYIPWSCILVNLTRFGLSDLLQRRSSPGPSPDWLEGVLIEHGEPSRDTTPPNGPFEPTLVALGLTETCNLRCAYCHSDAGGPSQKTISTEICNAALTLAAKNAARLRTDFEVSFTGPGEPTTAWSALEYSTLRAYELAEQYGVDLDLSMATNGVFGFGKASFIVDRFSGVSLSFDGPQEIQDLHRPSFARGPSFPAVYKTARFFHDNWGSGRNCFRFALRATVSSASVHRMREIYEFFAAEFPRATVGFEMLNPLGRGALAADPRLQPPSQELFARNLAELIGLASPRRIINSGAGRLGELKTHFCKALAMPTMNVAPNGNVLACQRDGAPDYFSYGSYNPESKTFDIDDERMQYFRTLSVDSYPECKECVARYHCAGECHDLRRVGATRCEVNRSLLKAHLAEAATAA